MPDPATIARQLAHGFEAHDDRDRSAARAHFRAVDRFPFRHDGADPDRAADAYVAALWRKDRIEDACRRGGEIVPAHVASADWTPVTEALADRCEAVGIDQSYATRTAVAWRCHKAGGDYWTPLMRAQMYELRAALQAPTYPDKPRHGTQGFGALPARYLVGVECHDARQWEEAIAVMGPYFERIAAAHDSE